MLISNSGVDSNGNVLCTNLQNCHNNFNCHDCVDSNDNKNCKRLQKSDHNQDCTDCEPSIIKPPKSIIVADTGHRSAVVDCNENIDCQDGKSSDGNQNCRRLRYSHSNMNCIDCKLT